MGTKYGTNQDDSIVGALDEDILRGLGRDDVLQGMAGDDVLYGDDVGEDIGGDIGKGTGLNGEVYNTSHHLNHISHADWKIANLPLSASFVATELDYPNGSTDRVGPHTYLTQFLGSDAASLNFHNGSGNFKVKTVVMHISGYIYIPEGTHWFYMKSDDGFRLKIGDDTILHYDSNGFHDDYDSRYYEGGVYEVDLVWYQNDGNAGLELHSSLPGDISDYLYQSLDDTGLPLEDPDGDGRYTLIDAEPPGDDTLEGGDGNDTLFGNEENDLLFGGADNDSLSGDEGNDTLDGGSGSDWQFGGDGNDVVSFDSDDAFMGGGAGNDTLLGTDGDDAILLGNSNFDQSEKHSGFEVVNLGEGNNLLIGANGGSLSDPGAPLLVEGGSGGDVISLWEIGNDLIDARGGTDTVYGGPGDDLIFGGDAQDFLYPGAGSDTVYGDAGDDVYHVGLGDGSNWLVDAHDGSENNGLILFHGYNDPEWDDYYGVSPENFDYSVEDMMVDSGSGPQSERVVTVTFDNGLNPGDAAYQEAEVKFIAGTIETLNLWDHADVIGIMAPPTAGDFTVYQYQWNDTTESFDPVV